MAATGTPAASAASYGNILSSLKPLLMFREGFTAVPLWDVKQWSWGFGSRVPDSVDNKNIKPKGTITKEKAWTEALKFIEDHYKYLSKLIKVPLSPNQWAALLSFSYNLGPGNADNLVANINKKDNAALMTQWRKYVIADGKRNQGLVDRREHELQLWNS